jgi:hypothetical protein
MTNHAEAFVIPLGHAKPGIAGVSAGAAHQQREALTSSAVSRSIF